MADTQTAPVKIKSMTDAISDIYTLNAVGTPIIVARTTDPITVAGLLTEPESKGTAKVGTINMSWGLARKAWFLPGTSEALLIDKFRSSAVPGSWLNLLQWIRDLIKDSDGFGGFDTIRRLIYVYNAGASLSGPKTDPVFTQGLIDLIPELKTTNTSLVLFEGPSFHMSGYLSTYTTYVDVPLPNTETILEHIRGMSETFSEGEVHEDREAAANALKGLTYWEIEQGYALEWTKNNYGLPEAKSLLALKEEIISASPALRLITETPRMDHVKGHENLKRFLRATAGNPGAKGTILLGVQGVGKSMCAQALAGEVGLPLVEFNLSAVFGGIIGQSEGQMHQALDIIRAVSPCIVFLDELEKALAGAKGSGRSDAGVTTRVTAELLKFLQDRPDGIYVIATCNDVESIDPEYLRAERWDALFFTDLPTYSEREQILTHYKGVYKQKKDTTVGAIDLEGWTGAEIKSLCRIAHLMGSPLIDAKQYVVPISQTRKEDIDRLREVWKPRCVAASDDDTTMVNTDSSTGAGKKKARSLIVN